MEDTRKELWHLFDQINSRADYARHLASALADFDQEGVEGFSDPEKAYEVVPDALLQTLAATLQEIGQLARQGINLTTPAAE